MSSNLKREAHIYLRALKEEGIDHLYLPTKRINPFSLDQKKTNPSLDQQNAKDALLALRQSVLACTKCDELARTRNSVVFGAGNIKAQLMFVGEAPGQEEDLQGLPFVGRAGQLLTKIIESIGLDRKQVFIANVLKCRPPQNRQPHPEEILNCQGYLVRQIELIQPKIICCLGAFASQTLLKTEESITHLRGKFFAYHSAKIICTYHPAYLLRNPSEKRKVWEDMKLIKKELDSFKS